MTILAWDTDTEWDSAQSEDRVRHFGTDDLAASSVQLGFPPYDEFGNNGLLAYHPFHEDSGTTLADVVGSNSVSISGATPNQDLALGTSGVGFDGTDDYGQASSNIIPETSDQPFSVHFLLLPTEDIDSNFDQITIFQDHGRIYIEYGRTSGYFTFRIYDGAQNVANYSTTFTTGTLYQIICTFDGSNMEVYVNNVNEASGTGGWDPLDYAPTYHVKRDTTGNFWPGISGEWRYYDYALSASQVQTLWDTLQDGILTTGVKTS